MDEGADIIEAAYINDLWVALVRYQERMQGRAPVPALTPSQRELARRVRALVVAEDRHLERRGLQRPPRIPVQVRGRGVA